MAKHYFEQLNYTLGNEDTTLEQAILKRYPAKKILAICGSGGRSLALLSPGVEELTCVDLGEGQINIARLRLETYRQLNYSDFIRFWGYPPGNPDGDTHFRRRLFTQMTLESDLRAFWEKLFSELNWRSPLYLGKWERTFALMAKVARVLLGKNYDTILQFDSVEEQARYYREEFPMARWNILIAILGNKSFFNALLYKGHFIEKNVSESYIEYYRGAFERLFTTQVARRSFFVNLCFYGKLLHPDANPAEARESTHAAVKAALAAGARVNFTRSNIMDMSKTIRDIDFLSLSDVPSYFKGELERSFMQDLRPVFSSGGLCLNRYYLRVSQVDVTGYSELMGEFSDAVAQESVQMYRPQLLRCERR